MPRRNRNAHATAINADVLADQADTLAAEFGSLNVIRVCRVDEIQLYLASTRRVGASTRSAVLYDCLAAWINKQLTSEVVAANGRI